MKEELSRYIYLIVWIGISLILFASYEYLEEQITYSKIYTYFIATLVVNVGFAYNGYRKNKK